MGKESWTLERALSSDPKCAAELIAELLDRLSESGWSEKDIFKIRMGVEEAVVNAIKHGNCCDETKCIKVAIKGDPDLFWARIEDEGEGFAPSEVPDPTLAENIEKGSGRGVMLMKNCMDEVCFSERGNVVEMRKKRSDS